MTLHLLLRIPLPLIRVPSTCINLTISVRWHKRHLLSSKHVNVCLQTGAANHLSLGPCSVWGRAAWLLQI